MKRFKNLLLAFALINMNPSVQENFIISSYTVTIHGTSNLHDWDESVGKVTGTGVINGNNDGSLDLNALNIKMEVRSIKSDHSMMDNKTYDALKADANPYIIFILASPVKLIKGNTNTVSATGNLTIAGVTRPLNMQVKIYIPEQGKMIFEGAQAIKMSDYNVDPPTALFGTLRTGNDITLNFKTNFSIQN